MTIYNGVDKYLEKTWLLGIYTNTCEKKLYKTKPILAVVVIVEIVVVVVVGDRGGYDSASGGDGVGSAGGWWNYQTENILVSSMYLGKLSIKS